MASSTIRNLDDGLKRRLRVRAAENGRSMEEEAGTFRTAQSAKSSFPKDLGRAIHARFAPSAVWISNCPNADRCGRRTTSG